MQTPLNLKGRLFAKPSLPQVLGQPKKCETLYIIYSFLGQKLEGTEWESQESEHLHFLPSPLMTPSLLRPSENQFDGVGSSHARISQSGCTFSRFLIGLVVHLLLATPAT